MTSPLFGIVPAGQPLITEPASTPSPSSLLYSLPASKPFSHIVVFMLPGVSLPPGTAAAIYLAAGSNTAGSGSGPNFRFLGAIGPGKESAMFKVTAGESGLVMGISVEAEDAVAAQLQTLAANKTSNPGAGSSSQPSTAILAQRIIQNAFNFLSSFSGAAGPGGVEVVPLKAFEDWWRKFESRVRSDPSFLEKQSD
ncbi:hypothetical protein B0J13DRAFT_39891 [Dactylonectria estremocensis]|uniref:Hikeshi-like domain-containing protein n=1 Tax=Dactylonectria estremocensis TaxID=1079267 RepID=A0A9P9FL17_9HYPO|nr:hypothetical protein B0J13DRAFT_39891 [Dactylonectria estremocensis]